MLPISTIISWNILISECSIKLCHYKVTVLLDSMHAMYNAFQRSLYIYYTDCSIREYVSIYFKEIKLYVLKYAPNMVALCW